MRASSRLAADLLESLDQERLGGMIKGALASRLRGIEVAPLFGRALERQSPATAICRCSMP